MSSFTGVFGSTAPLIGVVHLPPLPGAPRHAESVEAIVARAVRDAAAIRTGGMDAIIVENFGDAPFFADRVPPETIAVMTRIVRAVVEAAGGAPVGVNVLRNDAAAALAIALAAGAAFVRVNVHVGAAWTDQGLIAGRAAETLRLRSRLCPETLILADVGVKHARSAGDRPLTDEAEDCARRGLADALIVTGTATGSAALPGELADVKAAADPTPVLAGSGVTPETVAAVLEVADGVIAGSCLRTDGRAGGAVDEARVTAFVQHARGGPS